MTLLAIAVLHAAAGNLAIASGTRIYYGASWAYYTYDPWLNCTLLYGCRDPLQLRLEFERDRRMQELRELARPPEPRAHGYDGPWGRRNYVPPATPEANIQPAYRGASQLRPEYKQSVQPAAERLPEPRK